MSPKLKKMLSDADKVLTRISNAKFITLTYNFGGLTHTKCVLDDEKLSSENCKIIRELVKEVGSLLEGKLPPHFYLKKRNPYAHIYERIITKFGHSYKDCHDLQMEDLTQYIRWLGENPS